MVTLVLIVVTTTGGWADLRLGDVNSLKGATTSVCLSYLFPAVIVYNALRSRGSDSRARTSLSVNYKPMGSETFDSMTNASSAACGARPFQLKYLGQHPRRWRGVAVVIMILACLLSAAGLSAFGLNKSGLIPERMRPSMHQLNQEVAALKTVLVSTSPLSDLDTPIPPSELPMWKEVWWSLQEACEVELSVEQCQDTTADATIGIIVDAVRVEVAGDVQVLLQTLTQDQTALQRVTAAYFILLDIQSSRIFVEQN